MESLNGQSHTFTTLIQQSNLRYFYFYRHEGLMQIKATFQRIQLGLLT